MNQKSVCHLFDDYVDQLLPEPDQQAFEEHIRECDACHTAWSQWEQIRGLVREGYSTIEPQIEPVLNVKSQAADRFSWWLAIAATLMLGTTIALVTQLKNNNLPLMAGSQKSDPADQQNDSRDSIGLIAKEVVRRPRAATQFAEPSFGVFAGGSDEFTVYHVFQNRFQKVDTDGRDRDFNPNQF